MNRLKAWMIGSAALPVVVALAFSVSVSVANAQFTTPASGVTNTTGVGAVLCNFIATFFWIVIVVSVIMVLVAAFQYVTAGDDTEKTTKARRTITYAAIGIAVALLAYALPPIVTSLFPNASSNLQLDSTCSPASF